MKNLLLPLFFLPLVASAQNKSDGYLVLRGGISPKSDAVKGVAFISVGVSKKKEVGFGLGVGYIDYDRPYIPLTVDISFFGTKNKISPIVIGQAGYGVYNNDRTGITIRGAFTGSLNAGVAFPMKSKRVFLTAGAMSNGFVTTTKIGSVTQKNSSNDTRFVATFGVVL